MRKKPRSDDGREKAFSVAEQVTVTKTTAEKNPAAVALGRLGAKKGGIARAKKLSATRRREIAIGAANKRWRRA